MRIAVTVYGSTISPLFEAARRLMVADVGHGNAQIRSEEEIGRLDLSQRIALLTKLGVRVLACGAISEFSHNALSERGFQVYPWVSGEVQDVFGILVRRFDSNVKETETVMIAIPSLGPELFERVAPTFRSAGYLLFVEGGDLQTVEATDGFAGEKGCYRLVRQIIEAEARVLLTGRCGPNALGLLTIAGVDVIQGVEGSVKEAIDTYATCVNQTVRDRLRRASGQWQDAAIRKEIEGGVGRGNRGPSGASRHGKASRRRG